MNCSEVKTLLSAYYDDELSSERRAEVECHVAGCNDCAKELEGFRGLSSVAKGLALPEPPARIWTRLESQLNKDLVPQAPVVRRRAIGPLVASRPLVRFGLAAAAVIAIAITWFAFRTGPAHNGDQEFVAVFGQYLEQFDRDPQAAQQILLDRYESQATDARQAVSLVGYRPAVADGLPPGYSVKSMYVMKLPCCTCVQCQCQRANGTSLAIFEHNGQEPEWFGDRPKTTAMCNDTPCSIVALEGTLAAEWKRGERVVTVIGARDQAEVNELVAWFDDRKRAAVH